MWRSPRVEAYQEGEADEARQLELDSVEEARVNALTQSARYLQGIMTATSSKDPSTLEI